MTQEDKELLLKDLCARLPYDVLVRRYVYTTPVDSIQSVELLDLGWLEELYAEEAEFKPYLFPLSSMTEEQYKYISYNFGRDGLDYIKYGTCDFHSSTLNIEDIYELVDWLNKNQFDYRGLIEKGLALDATEKRVYDFKLIEK